MRSPRIRIAAVGLAVGLAFSAAACGSDSKSASTDSTTASTSAKASLTSENFGPGCAAVPTSGAGSFAGMAQDPAATAASNNPALSTLVAAVTAANLGDTLNGPGPFTIFAPSNEAFAKIPKATLDTLLADPSGDLTKILTYHVIAGKQLDAQQLADAGTEKTVNGAEVKIAESGDTIEINGQSAVVCGNVKTANGNVMIIDTVLMPPTDSSATAASLSKENFGSGCAAVPTSGAGSFAGMAQDPAATAASNNPALSTLVAAVTAANLGDTLNGPGPFTIFAPSNDAFAKLPKATLDAVLADPTGALTKILTYHVIAGKSLDAQALADAGTEPTVNGADVTIAKSGDTITINGESAVVCGNVKTANGTVQIIDTVLMPPS